MDLAVTEMRLGGRRVFTGIVREVGRVHAFDGHRLEYTGFRDERRGTGESMNYSMATGAISGTGTVTVYEGGLEIMNDEGTSSTVIAQAAAIVRLDV